MPKTSLFPYLHQASSRSRDDYYSKEHSHSKKQKSIHQSIQGKKDKKDKCGCCHFAKYANMDDRIDSSITVGKYVRQIWPDCPCELFGSLKESSFQESCPEYQTFLTTMHSISHIPVKSYFCSARNGNFEHLPLFEQRATINDRVIYCRKKTTHDQDQDQDLFEDSSVESDCCAQLRIELGKEHHHVQAILISQIEQLQSQLNLQQYFIQSILGQGGSSDKSTANNPSTPDHNSLKD